MAEDGGIGGTGLTLEDLSDYLDAGRRPADPVIDTNPECQAVLASLERVAALSRDLVAQETAGAVEEGWFAGLMRAVTVDVRAGRDIPLGDDAGARLVVTEGAIRGVLRERGDAVPGVLVERTRLVGEVTDPEATIDVAIEISVAYGTSMPGAAAAVRAAVVEAVARHTALRIGAVDVTVVGVHGGDRGSGDS